ncbi:MAG: exonuclease domain-containing protein [Rhodobacteraceae bacterium]|nr:exonuclease domain-containing protein [Paracoccaceae bacterium]
MAGLDSAIIFDCEYLVVPDAPRRFWCGPYDPDPVVAQIGAVRLALEGDFELEATFTSYINPVDRTGTAYKIDPFFTDLTGITQATIDQQGVPLSDALAAFDAFSRGARFWSWGKDELNLMAISTYVAGVPPSIPPTRFGNACSLLLAADIPYDTVKSLRSNTIAAHFGIEHDGKAHDALGDAMSVGLVLQHLLRDGRLPPSAFA